LRRRPGLPLLQGLRPIDARRVPSEAIAGVTLAALAIPEVMGYTAIAGMPVITGLYTLLIPMILFAILGSSRHLVVGADSATAAITAAGLAGLATAGSPEYVAMACLLAIIAGGYVVAASVLRLGFLANFLSRTVLIGFLTGVGIQVACGSFPGLFGLPNEGLRPIPQVVNALRTLGDANWPTFALAAAVVLVIAVGGKLAPKIPWALLAVVAGIAAMAVLPLSSYGIAKIGAIPSGLPHLTLPRVDPAVLPNLLVTGASILVVILAQSAATARAYAAKFNDALDENVDLIGLGVANLGAGLTGTFVVNGSPTKTAMVDKAGGRSQLAQLITALIVLVVLLYLTKPLSYLPVAVLDAVVFLIGLQLVKLRDMRTVWRLRPVEFVVALLTAATVVAVGVREGILLAIAISIVAHLRHSYRPYDRLLFPTPDGDWNDGPLATGVQATTGLLMYRFGASLYYANANRFAAEVEQLVAEALCPVRWFCLVAGNIGDLDYSGSLVLRTLIDDLAQYGVTFVLCDVADPVMNELRRDGLLDVIGADKVFVNKGAALAAFRALPPLDSTAQPSSTGDGPSPSCD
jgi:high affinity sulfate transporter 1